MKICVIIIIAYIDVFYTKFIYLENNMRFNFE